MLSRACWAISVPWSQVRERRSCAGMVAVAATMASRTAVRELSEQNGPGLRHDTRPVTGDLRDGPAPCRSHVRSASRSSGFLVHQQDKNPSNNSYFRASRARVEDPRSDDYCNTGATQPKVGAQPSRWAVLRRFDDELLVAVAPHVQELVAGWPPVRHWAGHPGTTVCPAGGTSACVIHCGLRVGP